MASLPLADTKPPALPQFLREAGSLAVLRWKRLRVPRVKAADAAAHRVLVLPGFLASDESTRPFRAALAAAGYRAHGWKQGLNLGAKAELFDRMETRLEHVAATGPVTIIGWSLGGLYARELAKRRPELVARVITLGTPFSGNPRANHAWWLYEMLAGHKVDRPPLEVVLHEKPPVPTIAFWSRQDGIVAPASARGKAGECDESIELDCTHMGFMTARCAVDAVLARLAA